MSQRKYHMQFREVMPGISNIPFIATIWILLSSCASAQTSIPRILVEPETQRAIPLVIHTPAPSACTLPCPVAIFGTGYLVTAEEYSAIGSTLAEAGYLAIVVQYDLPDDPPMPDTGDLRSDRGPFWHRGVLALTTVLARLPPEFPGYAWSRLTLLGHSQGGDIAALFANQNPERLEALITLDNRRVPLPREAPFPILSLRSADQLADAGVLPSASTAACIVTLPGTRHDDMTDGGPEATRGPLLAALRSFIGTHRCPSL